MTIDSCFLNVLPIGIVDLLRENATLSHSRSMKKLIAPVDQGMAGDENMPSLKEGGHHVTACVSENEMV